MTAEFPRDFLGLAIPEQPDKYYFIVRGQRIVLEADSTIQTIMEKLQSYKSRVSLNFEVTLSFISFAAVNLDLVEGKKGFFLYHSVLHVAYPTEAHHEIG